MSEPLAYVKSNRPFDPAETTLGGLLAGAAAAVPDRVALRFLAPGGVVELTYAEWLARAQDVAQDLATRFAPGDRLVIWMGNCPDWSIAQFGAAMAGLIVVAINPGCAPAELQYFLSQSGARGIILNRDFRGRDQLALIEALRSDLPALEHVIEPGTGFGRAGRHGTLPDPDPQDAAMIQYTSGTTGKPKGALLSHRGLVNATRASEQVFALPAGSGWVNTVPMYTTSGSVFVTMMALWNRGTQIMLPGFDPELVFQAVETHGGSFVPLVPTMALAVLDHPARAGRDLSALEVVVIGGSTIAPTLIARIDAELGAEVMVIFGQTEACSTLCLTPRGDTMEHLTTTIGYPLAGNEIRIIDPATGRPLAMGEVGEICARGPSVMLGYYNMPEKTAEALDSDGWLRTGDLGSLTPDGYPRLTGRLKEMIIRGGSNIYPREVEAALAELPGIADSAVFGIPDAHYGEQVIAAIRLRAGITLTEAMMRGWLAERIAKYKIPSQFWVVDGFPLTASGKIQKFELRAQYLAAQPG